MEHRGNLDLTNRIEMLEKQKEFLQATCRRAGKEINLLKDQYNIGVDKFSNEPGLADKLLSVGEFPIKKGINKINTAALTMVNNTIMNFDETYMKR